jgi:tetratricopeptide (TPR) repeat protein
MNQPRLFLSAVSHELKTARKAVADTVGRMGFEVVSQDNFSTGHGHLQQWLREQLDTCEGLIQIVGDGYGAEPPEADTDYGRVSYTQFELLYAWKTRQIKTWVILAGAGVTRDTPLEGLDLPGDAVDTVPPSYQSERRGLQQAYIVRLKQENHLYHPAANDTALENIVLKRRDELAALRAQWQAWLDKDAQFKQQTSAQLDALTAASKITTAKIRAHLHETVNETYRRELAQAEQTADWQQRQHLRDAANAAHQSRLGRIDELAASFAEMEGRGQINSVFKELSRILADQGVDEAIAFVASQRSRILQTVHARAAAAQASNRADLQPLLQAAGLHESKGQAAEARALYADILSAEPDWPLALYGYIRFLVNQGDEASVRTTQADAQRHYEEAHRRALHLTELDPGNTGWQRDLSVSYEKLGNVAVAQGQLDQAARAYGDGLTIAKKLAASDPGNTQWQRDLSVSYNKRGDVALKQGQFDQAARAYGDGLTIRKTLATSDPGNTEWQRDLSVSYNKRGDVALKQGQFDQAARAYGDGLTTFKKLASNDPGNTQWQRDLSVSYEKLGDVAVAQGQLDQAARAYGDGLTIAKKLAASDPGNTEWQRDLSVSYDQLGVVAVAQGQLNQAARAYGDGLTIRKTLASSDSGNSQWQRDLSLSFFQISRLQARQKKWPIAIVNAEASLRIDEHLSQLDCTNATWQSDVKTSRAWLERVRQQAAASK